MKSSLSLFEIQKKIAKTIKEVSPSSELSSIVCEKPPISIQDRLEIYRDAYRARMTESLAEDFPRVQENIGENEFDQLAWSYIQEQPSRFASLAEVSQHFPKYLELISEELFELASIDWIEILSGHARSMDFKNKLSAKEIQQGVPFKLKTNPTLQSFIGKESIYIAFQCRDEVEVKLCRDFELNFFEQMQTSSTLQELSSLISSTNLAADEIQNLVIEWLKHEIVFCERINADEL